MNFQKTFTPIEKEINIATTTQELEKIRIRLLGRKGLVNQFFTKIKNLPIDEKKRFGQKLNLTKKELEKLINNKKKQLVNEEKVLIKSADQEFYHALTKKGHLHPITVTSNEINNFFKSLGFSTYEGPEIETDEYCFRRLNVPPDHPARDMQDSIYINEPEILLRTQASAIETRLLAKETPPFKAAFPARVYRNEKVNKSNHFVFHHYQAVAVDKDITMKDLIGTLNSLFQKLYGLKVRVRYRCKYYPEVEPGLGLDIRCFSCQGKGCSLCKGVGWIEMGGAGIIHPKVMTMANINPKIWRGFAFGLGLDRWAMAKYKIGDIRTLLGGNLAYKPNQS
ncbi:MAG: phenylalanine--tRNA ligase subunit alpha [Candidatus Shapirobacteria bacterium]|nr:phenylalanine--tRNA ligase subunit alpha [Candidatus Shapirobacteria bacterium]